MAPMERPIDFEDQKALPSEGMLREIGRIAILTASIEDILHAIIWQYLKVSDEAGKVITGERKLGRLQGDVIAYLNVQKAPKKVIDDLREIFSQLGRSAEIRNRCVHWIWHYPATDGKHRLDPPSYHKETNPRYYTVAEIAAVADDLVWIEARLYPHSRELRSLYKEIREEGTDHLPTPWLCIFPQPERQPKA